MAEMRAASAGLESSSISGGPSGAKVGCGRLWDWRWWVTVSALARMRVASWRMWDVMAAVEGGR